MSGVLDEQMERDEAIAEADAQQHAQPALPVEVVVNCRGQSRALHLDAATTTISDLRLQLFEATSVAPEYQKVVTTNSTLRTALAKHPVATNVTATSNNGEGAGATGGIPQQREATLSQLGFTQGAGASKGETPTLKLMLVGPRLDELESVRNGDEQSAKMNRPRQYHPSMLRGNKPRSTASSSATSSLFHSVRVHDLTPPSAPEHDLVLSRLKQLSSDEAVLHVCRLHGFQVGELTELLPHEHPNLLGLNENMGQRISLRLRTDRYDGLQPYRDTRRVLLHELAHNKVNDHPPEFKILNSELNAQVEAYEQAKRQGTHRLIEGDVYVPSEAPDGTSSDSQSTTAHVLGGTTNAAAGMVPQDAASRRARVLDATMRRLEKAEADIERGCGSTSSA